MNIWILVPLRHHYERVPSIEGLIEMLAVNASIERISVFAPGANYILNDKVEHVPLSEGSRPGYSRLFLAVTDWRGTLKRIWSRGAPDFVVAVDKWGLYISTFISIRNKIDVVYWNLEIRSKKETQNSMRRVLINIERRLARRSAMVIVQDQWREGGLRRAGIIDRDSCVLYLPNSTTGYAIHHKGRFLREKYGVPENERIVLYVGSLIDNFYVEELATAANALVSARLVMHCPPTNGDHSIRKSVKAIARACEGKLILSEELLNKNELNLLISSADIGIALFRPVEGNAENEILMGKSSGKIALYLKYGIPVITSRYESVQWIERHNAGVLVQSCSPESLSSAVTTISSDSETFNSGARDAFNEELLLAPYVQRITEWFRKNKKCH